MAEINLDCPEARKSLLPYLTGRLEGVQAATFEAHVKACSYCSELVGDRKKALQAVLAAVEEKAHPAHASQKKESAQTLWKGIQTKPLVLSACLALGLIGVSWYVRPGSDVFGDKFTLPASQEAAPTDAKGSNPEMDPGSGTEPLKEETTEASAPATALDSQATPPTNEAPPVEKKASDGENDTKVAVSTPPARVKNPPPANKKSNKTVTNPKKTAKSAAKLTSPPKTRDPQPNRVEVFDENGKRIGETILPRGYQS